MPGITKEVKTIFKTSDGKTFEDLKAAEAHQKIIDSCGYFKVRFGSDLNEGRHLLKNYGYVKVEGMKYDGQMQKICEHFCYKLFGNEYDFIQGVYIESAFIPMWSVEKVSADEALQMDMIGRISLDENDKVFMECNKKLHYSFGDMKKVIYK
jgi:hypothetical protein